MTPLKIFTQVVKAQEAVGYRSQVVPSLAGAAAVHAKTEVPNPLMADRHYMVQAVAVVGLMPVISLEQVAHQAL